MCGVLAWVVCWPDSLQRGHSPVSFTLRAKARCCRCRCLCLCLCFAFVSLGCDSNVQRWCMLAWLLHVLSTGAYVRVRVCAHTLRVMYCGVAVRRVFGRRWHKARPAEAARQRFVCGSIMMLLNIALLIPSPFCPRTQDTLTNTLTNTL